MHAASALDVIQQAEQKSSVKIAQTAKGEATVEVKVYDGTDPGELDAIREMAVAAYKATVSQVRT